MSRDRPWVSTWPSPVLGADVLGEVGACVSEAWVVDGSCEPLIEQLIDLGRPAVVDQIANP